jgi:hypothetical protein
MIDELQVVRIIRQTKAIHWWIDKQIADGKSNEQIERELPLAVAFIVGEIGPQELLNLIHNKEST